MTRTRQNTRYTGRQNRRLTGRLTRGLCRHTARSTGRLASGLTGWKRNLREVTKGHIHRNLRRITKQIVTGHKHIDQLRQARTHTDTLVERTQPTNKLIVRQTEKTQLRKRGGSVKRKTARQTVPAHVQPVQCVQSKQSGRQRTGQAVARERHELDALQIAQLGRNRPRQVVAAQKQVR